MADGEPKVTLHWLNGSRAQGTLWLLEQLQIPYELKVYHREKSFLAPPELAKIHPLGKSPVVTIAAPGVAEPITLAESPFIVQYLSEHFPKGQDLVPKRWKDGQEGKIGGETGQWMRYQYLMYFSEGSFMATLVRYFIMSGLKGNRVPFFIRPITKVVANQIVSMLLFPDLKKQFALLESYLQTSPEGEGYLCGQHLTGADIMLAYGLIAGKSGFFDDMGTWDKGSFAATFPRLAEYIQRLEKEPGWVRSVEKIRGLEGSFSLVPGQPPAPRPSL